MKAFFEHIGSILNAEILNISPLAGGDINEVYLLTTPKGKVVLKYDNSRNLPELFEKEAKGLHLLRTSHAFRIPEVISHGTFQETAYLLLSYIPSGIANDAFWESFALSLSQLHRGKQNEYGLDHSNYIGSLVQNNSPCESGAEFYITQRMEPQFKMATDNGFSFKRLERFYKNISGIIPEEPASLIHGDLWNGNYMVGENGEPVLIDPAVTFAHREMDLAMMQLFGGFPNRVYDIYQEHAPLTGDWQTRVPLWQLYYILVHLNLFGASYLSQTREIISRFS